MAIPYDALSAVALGCSCSYLLSNKAKVELLRHRVVTFLFILNIGGTAARNDGVLSPRSMKIFTIGDECLVQFNF